MNYDELLEQLNDLKSIGCDLSRLPVIFETKKGTRHEINFLKLCVNSNHQSNRHVKLSKFKK